MTKTIVILTDGMADEPIAELGGKTPLEHAATPHMDAIAKTGACGTLFTLPEGYPTSSDVANMSVLGYDPADHYTGRGPLEALSQNIELADHDVAWRCNLVNVDGNVLMDYSGGHIEHADAVTLVRDLGNEFNCDEFSIHSGVSYRNLLITHGSQFTAAVRYEKPDDSQGKSIDGLLLKPADDSIESKRTADFLNDVMVRTRPFLERHEVNRRRQNPANMLWLSSPGARPDLPSFQEKYGVKSGAIISAVDVIFGLGKCVGLEIIHVPGATGFIDTNYEGKADAAIAALDTHDFVYLHIEAADECSHMGDLKLKLQAIEDIDRRVVGPVRDRLIGKNVTLAVLPDHPVPLRLRVHTRDPVPFAISGPHITPDSCLCFSESVARAGNLGALRRDEFMKLALNVS